MDIQLDKQRVNLLLTINTLLLHRYTQNHDQNLLKRLHANLTCIGELSEKFNNAGNTNKHIFPTILSPPTDSPELVELYVRLQQLFPEGVQILQRRTLLLRQEQLKRQFQQQPPPPQQQQQQPGQQMGQQGIPQGVPQGVPGMHPQATQLQGQPPQQGQGMPQFNQGGITQQGQTFW